MFLINPSLTPNSLTNNKLNDLLTDIDNTIASFTKIQYYNDVFGYTGFVDYERYDKLCDYREILLDKLIGCNCLEDEFLIYITSRIQQLTNTFC